MAATINIPVYSDALVVLGTAGVVVPLVRYLGLNPVLGYLGAGALLGPLGLGSFIDKLPFLYWFTVVDAKNVSGIAELGVVFLLFLIGLELSYDRLLSMRRLVFGLGGSQVVITVVLAFRHHRMDWTSAIGRRHPWSLPRAYPRPRSFLKFLRHTASCPQAQAERAFLSCWRRTSP